MNTELKLRFILLYKRLFLGKQRIHSVTVAKSDYASELRKAIKSECSPPLDNVDASSLELFTVTEEAVKSVRELYTKLQNGEALELTEWKAHPLDEMEPVGETFGQLNASSIHLIVDCTEAYRPSLSINTVAGPEPMDWSVGSFSGNSGVPSEDHKRKRLSDPDRIKELKKKYGYTPRLGGLGGTLRSGPEGSTWQHFEGIDLNKPDEFVARTSTVTRLIQHLQKHRVLLVRSPPMAGKSSLAQLVEWHLNGSEASRTGIIRVIRMSLLWMGRSVTKWTFEEQFQQLMGGTPWEEFMYECTYIKTIFIVDEVQLLYARPENRLHDHGGSVFWESVKSAQAGGQLHIVMFASYGYRAGYHVSPSQEVYNTTPLRIGENNTWSLEDVRFTDGEDGEYAEYFAKVSQKFFPTLSIQDRDALRTHIGNTTLRHPGLVSFILYTIGSAFHQRIKYGGEPITWPLIFEYMTSEAFISSIRADARANSPFKHLSSEELRICDSVFREPDGLPISQDENDPQSAIIVRLRRRHLLSHAYNHSTNQFELNFAAPILRQIYMQQRYGCEKEVTLTTDTFQEFIINTFQCVNRDVLRRTRGVGRDGHLLERTWQMEFYKAATKVLGKTAIVSPDAGAWCGSSGFLDFWVDDGRAWAIELLRDGNNVKSHLDRASGQYQRIMEIAKEWILIDIRRPGLPRSTETNPNYVAVECIEDWESVLVRFPGASDAIRVNLMRGIAEPLEQA